VDPEEVADAEDRATEGAALDKNQKEIVLEGVPEQDESGREDVREYARHFGIESEKALKMLEKFQRNGDIAGGYEGSFRVY
jgi:endonuclease V-like protein UPF0215 family